jgi:hypothetical protein
MASITIASVAVPNWQRDSDVELRIYARSSFIAADGTLVAEGHPDFDEAVAGNWFVRAACSLSSSVLTIPSITLISTTDSQDNPAAEYSAYFYTTEGEQIGAFGAFDLFKLPASPASTTWKDIQLAQGGNL